MIGTGIGATVSTPIANNLLESQIEEQENTKVAQEQKFGRTGNMKSSILGGAKSTQGSVEYLDNINIKILLQIIGIGIILTIISSLVGIIFVLRYDPLKILANRA